MKAMLLMTGAMVAFAGTAAADVDTTGKDLDQFAHSAAQEIAGAREVVGHDSDGHAKWAGVWMDKEKACPNGRLGPDGKRVLTEGGRFAADHGGRLILYAPRANAPVMEREAKEVATKIVVRGNDMVGDHCYLVIGK